MPKVKSSKKKSIKRKPSGKTTSKKTVKKKATRKKTAKKKTLKKKVSARKKASKKTALKKAATRKRSPQSGSVPVKSFSIEPGPQPQGIPPVEEPTQIEEALGTVTHYYSHLGVAVVQINKGELRTGAMIHITGHTTDFTQVVESMEYEHQHVDQALPGQSVGIRVKDHAREHDIVYLVK